MPNHPLKKNPLNTTHVISLVCLISSLIGCGSNPPAPVIDRAPAKPSKPEVSSKTETSSTPKASTANRPTYKPGDWRPDTYIVKKGDNLFSIGLELGYYYKDIAQANNIAAPYPIRVGQQLNLKTLKEKVAGSGVNTTGAGSETRPNQTDSQSNQPEANADGVVITPINPESVGTTATTVAPPIVIAIAEPKAIREPYSEESLKRPLPAAKSVITKPNSVTTTVTTPANAESGVKPEIKPEGKPETKPEVKPSIESPEDMEWNWPTKGKVIANFNEASNKGIDIAGIAGQAVNAAAPGKVIYSGSDLRGYGKLVIIKHNATYLSVYAHNSLILVKEGQPIARGQKIAEMGNSDSNSVKLHFEIRRQGKSVDPSKYLTANN